MWHLLENERGKRQTEDSWNAAGYQKAAFLQPNRIPSALSCNGVRFNKYLWASFANSHVRRIPNYTDISRILNSAGTKNNKHITNDIGRQEGWSLQDKHLAYVPRTER